MTVLLAVPNVAIAQSLTGVGAPSITASATDSTREGTGAIRPAASSEIPRAARTARTPAAAAYMEGR